MRRRSMLVGGSVFTWAYAPRLASAAGARDARLVTIILRGAMDGLSAVAPLDDPDYAALREGIALSRTGDRPALPLDGFFALHPAMPNLARQYKAGQALVLHAVASPYRERSHFEGQDVLESGLAGPGVVATGWLNRALLALPQGARVAPRGLAVGPMTPLVIRGAAPVLGWAPQGMARADEDLAARVLDLYRHRDPALAEALGRGLETDRMARRGGEEIRPRGGMDSPDGMRAAAQGAARLLAQADGPRIAALAFDGWDTHANEGGATGRLSQLLGGLDGAFAAFEAGMGPAWKDTAILVVTEFGRTARVNGTIGTDHGTATVAFLVGGAIRGGRVIADWPGLKPAALYEARDLRPTLDLRAAAKGVLADLLGITAPVLATTVFPDSAAVAPLRGLIAPA